METLCSPKGIKCYENMTLAFSKCLTPCRGLYADIMNINSDESSVEDMGVFDDLLKHYERYKRAYVDDITYPIGLKGIIKGLYNS